VILKPAPRGLGIVASGPVKKMLELAGVKDAWTFSRGRTRAKYNTVMAVYRALGSINEMKNISETNII
jgi:small subunit ribosomal protein S5